MKKAAAYQVQVDNDASFASPEFSVRHGQLPRRPDGGAASRPELLAGASLVEETTSSWSQGSFDVSPVGVPVPTSPADGSSLVQPDNPPLLRWDGAQGATSYTVQLDGDADFIGAKSYTTKTTSLVVPDPLIVGTYYWRVIATKAAGIVSQPSATSQLLRRSRWQRPPRPTRRTASTSRCRRSSSTGLPSRGRRATTSQVAHDAAFTSIIDNATGITGTRYSRAISLDNNQYWWRVRAIDLLGQATPWTTSQNGFRRNYPEQPTALYPLGTSSVPRGRRVRRPLPELDPRQARQRSTRSRWPTTRTSRPTSAPARRRSPRTRSSRAAPDGGPRAASTPASTGGGCGPSTMRATEHRSLGLYSEGQAFTLERARRRRRPGWHAVRAGLRDRDRRQRLPDRPGRRLHATTVCGNVPATPVLDWDVQQYAKFYRVLVSEDADFTNIVTNVVTNESRLALTAPLRESSAGGSYYWYVIPCRGGTLASPSTCGPSPQSVSGLPGVKQFRKVSPAVTGLSSSDPAGTDITFAWTDYFTTNQATPGGARRATSRPARTASRSTPSRRSPRRSSTPPRWTRRPTPRPTSSTPRARSTGASRPSTAAGSGCRGPRPAR